MSCSICQSEITNINTTTTECGHTFHTSCIFEWVHLRNHNNCPMCRALVIHDPFPADVETINVDEEDINDFLNFLDDVYVQERHQLNDLVNQKNTLQREIDELREQNNQLKQNVDELETSHDRQHQTICTLEHKVALYEKIPKRKTRRCSVCRGSDHDSRTCLHKPIHDAIKCSNCNQTGHNIRTCIAPPNKSLGRVIYDSDDDDF